LLTKLAYIWAAPNTLVGLAVGLVSMLGGTRMQVVAGVVEFYGGPISWLLERVPLAGGALAMTLGHVVWGQTSAALDVTRQHEHVHVRQYAMWGPLFLPAYAAASLIAWITGGRPYRDNWFERQAYDTCESP
jgi:hypothetical protein